MVVFQLNISGINEMIYPGFFFFYITKTLHFNIDMSASNVLTS